MEIELVHVLIVDSSDTCRGPFLAALLNEGLKDEGLSTRFLVESAGTKMRCDGNEADPMLIANINSLLLPALEKHRSRFIGNVATLGSARFILCVDTAAEHMVKSYHQERLKPGAKIVLLKEAGQGEGIRRPKKLQKEYLRLIEETVPLARSIIALLKTSSP